MLSWSNTNSNTGVPISTSALPVTVNGNLGYRGLWIPTAMDLTDQSGGLGRIGEQAVRTASTCFMRGLSEHIRMQTSSDVPWFWRRICFTFKGPELNTFSPLDTPTSQQTRYLDTSNGIQRLGFNELNNNTPNTINNHDAVIFRGAKGVDWNDIIIAPVDTSRVTLKYDKTVTLQSGNARGIVREFKQWHPMNHNITYADDESGDGETTAFTSVASKVGMGDFYVMDLIQTGANGTTTDLLQMVPNSTLYWHEK